MIMKFALLLGYNAAALGMSMPTKDASSYGSGVVSELLEAESVPDTAAIPVLDLSNTMPKNELSQSVRGTAFASSSSPTSRKHLFSSIPSIPSAANKLLWYTLLHGKCTIFNSTSRQLEFEMAAESAVSFTNAPFKHVLSPSVVDIVPPNISNWLRGQAIAIALHPEDTDPLHYIGSVTSTAKGVSTLTGERLESQGETIVGQEVGCVADVVKGIHGQSAVAVGECTYDGNGHVDIAVEGARTITGLGSILESRDLSTFQGLNAATYGDGGGYDVFSIDSASSSHVSGTTYFSTRIGTWGGAGNALVEKCSLFVDTRFLALSTGDTATCPSNQPDPHCGGTPDAWNEMSCSPYKYRPLTFNYQKPNACNGDIFTILTYGGDKARPWAHFTNSQWDTDDYWVFHACDGAGLQSDCLGDVKYVEHFKGRFGWSSQACEHDPNGDMRNYCKFVHPGTLTTYEEYESGWWNDGNADGDAPNGITSWMVASAANGGWGEWVGGTDINGKDCMGDMPQCYQQSKMIFDNPNPYIGADGVVNEWGCPMRAISYLTFPWVCTYSDIANDNFAYPSWGGDSQNVKCYADNEPGSYEGHAGWPPYVYIYYLLLYKSGGTYGACTDPEDWTIKGQKYWLNTDNGESVDTDGIEFFLEPCHDGDYNPATGLYCPF